MLLSKYADVKINSANIKRYERLGYDIPKIHNAKGRMIIDKNSPIKVLVEHLSKGSHSIVQCLCDYCLDKGEHKLIEKEYRTYLKNRSNMDKDCCRECFYSKVKDVALKKYGVDSFMKTKEFAEKSSETMIDKYGVVNFAQSEGYQDVVDKITLERNSKFITVNDDKCEIQLSNSSKIAYIDADDYNKCRKYRWYLSENGYVCSRIKEKTLYIHRIIAEPEDSMVVDHINHNKLDNTRKNLRVCTYQQNLMNKRILSNNTSGHTGVHKNKNTNKWSASIMINNKCMYLGEFKNIEDAVSKRKEYEIKIFGEYRYDKNLDHKNSK